MLDAPLLCVLYCVLWIQKHLHLYLRWSRAFVWNAPLRIKHFTGQTFIRVPPWSVAKLSYHWTFVHFSDGPCSDTGVKEVRWWRWGWLRWVFIYPSKRNRWLPAVGEVCGSMGGFKKPLWKINVPYMLLMAVWLRNTQKDKEHLFVVKNVSSTLCFSLSESLPLFVFESIRSRPLLLKLARYSYCTNWLWGTTLLSATMLTPGCVHCNSTLEAGKPQTQHIDVQWKKSEVQEQLFQRCY